MRHLFQNFEMKRPHLVMDDQAAVDTLLGHWAFRKHRTPIQIFNRATDKRRKHGLFSSSEQAGIGLSRELLENLALRFEHDNPDASDVELVNHLKAKATELKSKPVSLIFKRAR